MWSSLVLVQMVQIWYQGPSLFEELSRLSFFLSYLFSAKSLEPFKTTCIGLDPIWHRPASMYFPIFCKIFFLQGIIGTVTKKNFWKIYFFNVKKNMNLKIVITKLLSNSNKNLIYVCRPALFWWKWWKSLTKVHPYSKNHPECIFFISDLFSPETKKNWSPSKLYILCCSLFSHRPALMFFFQIFSKFPPCLLSFF